MSSDGFGSGRVRDRSVVGKFAPLQQHCCVHREKIDTASIEPILTVCEGGGEAFKNDTFSGPFKEGSMETLQ